MNLALGFDLTGDEPFLTKSLPMMASEFSRVLAIGHGVTEATRKTLAESHAGFEECATVDRSDAWTKLMMLARQNEFDWIMLLTGKECLMPGSAGWIVNHIHQMEVWRKCAQIVFFPRVTFWKSHLYVLQGADDFPDWQGRLVRVPVPGQPGVEFDGEYAIPFLNGKPLIGRPEAMFSSLLIYNYERVGKEMGSESDDGRYFFGPNPLRLMQ